MAKEKELTRNIRAIYVGRRLSGDNKIQHNFQVGKRTYSWSKARLCQIGRTYYIVEKKGEHYLKRTPEQAENQIPVSEQDVKDWEAADMICDYLLARKRAKAKAERARFKEIIDLLIPVFKNLSYLERRYFVEALAMQAERKLK